MDVTPEQKKPSRNGALAPDPVPPDSEVKPKLTRRTFTAQQKLKIVCSTCVLCLTLVCLWLSETLVHKLFGAAFPAQIKDCFSYISASIVLAFCAYHMYQAMKVTVTPYE